MAFFEHNKKIHVYLESFPKVEPDGEALRRGNPECLYKSECLFE
jgi:hypothetical protein